MQKYFLIFSQFFLVVITACTGNPQTDESNVTSTSPGVVTAVSTNTPQATPTATPDPTNTVTPMPTSTPAESPTPTPQPRSFTFYGDNPAQPVVPSGLSGEWDSKYINPGAVIFHDGRFHMFRNGFLEWPGLISVGYMTSDDGYTWTAVQDEPVFTSDEVPYLLPGQGADVSSVLVAEDGSWIMYFHTVSNTQTGLIGRATAASPLGPWLVDSEPILGPGETGSWDDRGLAWPNVIHTPDGYFMYYGARQLAKDTMIGLATSEDGVTWTKYDDPATLDAPFAESDPIIMPGDGWSKGEVDRARVVYTPEGYVMVYQGGALTRRGLAFSDDGIHWTHHPENPVITHEDFPISGTTWDTSLVYHDDTYFYFMEIGSMAGTDIYLTTHQGALRP